MNPNKIECSRFNSHNKYNEMLSNQHHKEKEVKSPCRNVCTLDHNGRCVGCYRNIEEIANWSTYSDELKRRIIIKLPLRMQLPEFFD